MEVPEDVRRIWEKYKLEESVRRHCLAVAKVAKRIAERIADNGQKVDLDAVIKGALLHDVGRAITNDPFLHFIKSAEILRREGFDEKIVRIAERHFSAGITAEEAEKIGITPKDYLPETLEEKIVSFADNITIGDREASFEDFLSRLDEIDRRSAELRWLTQKTRQRAAKMKEELERLSGMKF